MISEIELIAAAVSFGIGSYLFTNVVSTRLKKPKKKTALKNAKNLTEPVVRTAVQTFLEINRIEGNADIRNGIIYPFGKTAGVQNPGQAYARMIRNEYNAIVHRTGDLSVDRAALLCGAQDGVFALDLSLGDLLAIADILERVEK